MNDDATLIRRYAADHDDTAFGELVRRHLNLVWGAARRITGDADLARDVAQTVFIDLARKAARLPAGVPLAGWLYRAACLAAAKAVRTRVRRAERERETMSHPTPPDPAAEAAVALQPQVDEALQILSEADRSLVLQRYFEGRSFAAIGAAAGLSDDTAQKRVSRALERLREHFRRRGVNVGEGVLAASLALAAAEAAPAGLAASLSGTALAAAASTPVAGLLAAKLTWGLAAAAVVAVGGAAWEYHVGRGLERENADLRARLGTVAVPGPAPESRAEEHPSPELLRLRGEVARLRQELDGARAVARAARLQAASIGTPPAGPGTDVQAEMERAQAALERRVNDMKQLGLAARMFANDNRDALPTNFDQLHAFLQMKGDGTFGTGTPLEELEFHPHERTIGETEPQLILFRERNARQLPDGSWVRVYSMVDGSVQSPRSPNGDFSAFERDGTGTVANAPAKP